MSQTRPSCAMAEAAALDDGASLASGCQPSFTAQGLRFPEGPCNAPPRRPHAETDLPQPDRPEHLLSLIDDHRCLELSGSGDRLGGSTETVVSRRFFPAPSSPFEVSPHPRVKQRTNRCALAHRTEVRLLPLGPSPEVTRESFSRRTAPEVPSAQGPTPCPSARWPSRVAGFSSLSGLPPAGPWGPRRERKGSVFGSFGLPCAASDLLRHLLNQQIRGLDGVRALAG